MHVSLHEAKTQNSTVGEFTSMVGVGLPSV